MDNTFFDDFEKIDIKNPFSLYFNKTNQDVILADIKNDIILEFDDCINMNIDKVKKLYGDDGSTAISPSLRKETQEIILMCKQEMTLFKVHTFKDMIRKYIGYAYGWKWNDFKNWQIENILINAIADLIEHMAKPSQFVVGMKQISNVYRCVPNYDLDIYELICLYFKGVQIRENDKYVNGFSSEIVENKEQLIENVLNYSKRWEEY